MESHPGFVKYEPVSEKILSNRIGLLEYHRCEEMHQTPFECPTLVENGKPRFYRVKVVRRHRFTLDGVAKVYSSPIDEKNINDVRAENDAATNFLLNSNKFILKVYDCNIYSTIYESYLYNFEEFCKLQSEGINVRPKLDNRVVKFVRIKQLIKNDDGYRTTPFFREFMKHTLEFLNFLRARGFIYGGLHPHNILIVDEECTIKFRGLKNIKYINGNLQDLEDFLRLVRFCAHGGGRDISNPNNDDKICREAKEFLSIFVLNKGDPEHPSRYHYLEGYKKNRLNILKHPLFWDESMCMYYFLQTHAVLVACGLTTSRKYSSVPIINGFLQKLPANISKASADLEAVNVENPIPSSNPVSIINYIIAHIRHLEGHYPDGLDGLGGKFGPLGSHPIGFWSNLRAKFPGLITGVHTVMLRYTQSMSPLFRNHWEKFYPNVQ